MITYKHYLAAGITALALVAAACSSSSETEDAREVDTQTEIEETTTAAPETTSAQYHEDSFLHGETPFETTGNPDEPTIASLDLDAYKTFLEGEGYSCGAVISCIEIEKGVQTHFYSEEDIIGVKITGLRAGENIQAQADQTLATLRTAIDHAITNEEDAKLIQEWIDKQKVEEPVEESTETIGDYELKSYAAPEDNIPDYSYTIKPAN